MSFLLHHFHFRPLCNIMTHCYQNVSVEFACRAPLFSGYAVGWIWTSWQCKQWCGDDKSM